MVAAGRTSRIGEVGLLFATGCCVVLTPADRSVGRWEVTVSSTVTAAHWRRLLRPARSRRSTASCAGGARTWRGGLGDVRHLARRDHGPRVEGSASPRSRRGRATTKTSWPKAFKKNFPAELAKIRARLPKGVEISARIGQISHTPMGRRGTCAFGLRPAHRMGLYLRRDSREGERRRAGLPWCTPSHGGAP